MAENALWIADFLGQNAKITLWAHNGHIAKDPLYGGSGSMGHHLNQELSNLYQVVGFSFSLGSFTAVGQDQYGNYTGTMTHEITTEPRRNRLILFIIMLRTQTSPLTWMLFPLIPSGITG